MIKDRLTWRKEMSLDTLRYQKFPIEFYQSGGIFEFKHDNDGDPVLYVRSKFNVNIEILSKPLRQFLIFFMDQMDQRFSRERSWGLVFDAQGFGWHNIDFDFLHLIIKILKYYMPWSVKYVIIYEIPWFLESIWKGVQHFIPEDGKRLIRVYNKKTIGETIDPMNMPQVIGGLSKENHIFIPEGVEPATVIGKIELGLNDEEVNRIKKHLAKLDKEMGELIKV
uniref:CRAL-TRIO domain-containing protein n=2 Tax=Tetranychus urticae TaxID=32264 RepID=T1JSN6_TETUR